MGDKWTGLDWTSCCGNICSAFDIDVNLMYIIIIISLTTKSMETLFTHGNSSLGSSLV